jgi:hypothetical protein
VLVSSELRWGAKLGSSRLSLSGHVSLLCPSFLHTLQARGSGFPVLHDGFEQLCKIVSLMATIPTRLLLWFLPNRRHPIFLWSSCQSLFFPWQDNAITNIITNVRRFRFWTRVHRHVICQFQPSGCEKVRTL